MGKASREKQEKRQQKEYARIAERNEKGQNDPVARESALAALNNPISRVAITLKSRGSVIAELQKTPVEGQIDTLSRTAGVTSPSKLAKALTSKAPAEMDKGIRKLQKDGKPVTVDALCTEITSTPGFLKMCGQVGLSLEWFEDLARKRMEALKV